jgi:hypothetical protein
MTKRVVFALALPLALLAAHVGQTQPGRETEVRKARRPVPNQYIVVVEDGEDPQVVADIAEVAHKARRTRVFRHGLRGFSMRLRPDAAQRLAENPRVRFVEEDSAIQLTQSPTVWGLDRIDQRLGPLDGVYNIQALGTGVFVHVVDSGIRLSHVEFGGRASVVADYVDDDHDDDPLDIGNDDGNPLTPDGSDCNRGRDAQAA